MVARRVFVGFSLLLLVTLLADASLETSGERPRYKSPLGLAVEPSGRFAFVALHTANALAVVDLQKGQVLHEIPVGKRPYDVALHRGVAYVTCEADDTLVAVDLNARKVTKVFKVGQAPRNVSVDPQTGMIQVVCHDAGVLWTQHPGGASKREPLPPQPEGNFARPADLELILAKESAYRQAPRPANLFALGQAIFDGRPATDVSKIRLPLGLPTAGRTAFSPMNDLNVFSTGMDLAAHTRPNWFIPTAKAPEGRIFTNAFSFFLNSSSAASVLLLDEPAKGYPDPTAVVVKLPKQPAGKTLAPLAADNTKAHPLNGARVFISSGGADTVVVLDMDKAIMHARTHAQPNGMTGMMGVGMMGGQMMGMGGQTPGIWGGGVAGAGGFNGGMAGVSGFNGGGMMGGWGGGMGSGMMGGMQMAGMGGFSGFPPQPAPPGGPKPAVVPPGFGGAKGVGPGGLGLPRGPGAPSGTGGAAGAAGSSGGVGGIQGGMMGMAGMQSAFPSMRDDLRASSAYTIARLPTQANPRRMALAANGKTLVVSNHLADSLTVIDAEKLTVVGHISLNGPQPDKARRGEILFHSANFTVQQQFTCASCHPNNGSDGLSWNTAPTGVGESLNTRALHGVRDTSPFGWKGESETLEGRAKNTMREVHKHQLSDADAGAIAAYLETLDPPRPLPQKPGDSPAIARGKELFHGKANCKSCHRGPALTSDSPRAVILDQSGKLTPFDVPSLRGVARTAPYLHDGRAATLEAIFEQHNPQQRHGKAHELTGPERNDLVAFLKSL